MKSTLSLIVSLMAFLALGQNPAVTAAVANQWQLPLVNPCPDGSPQDYAVSYDMSRATVSGGFITTLVDGSANGYNGVSYVGHRAMATNNPAIIRGSRWADFPDVSASWYTNLNVVLAQTNTFFLEVCYPTYAAVGYTFDSTNSSYRNALALTSPQTLRLTANSTVTLANPLVAGQWYVVEVCFCGANSFVRTNGVDMQTGINTGSEGMSGLTIGQNYNHGASGGGPHLAYFRVYNRGLDPSEEAAVLTYFQCRFGTQ